MIKQVKNRPILAIVVVTLILTILLSWIVYEQLSLLQFINISFYFSSAYIILGLVILVVEKGFFDGISYSFRRMFKRNSVPEAEEDVNHITPLSELISLPYSQLLYSGLIVLIIMSIALWFYY
ncbi:MULTISPECIES: DUF3899 domain-containing protein [Bacillus]|uniref:DUF3899 domain-containing protein n=1 Tax=Bacillus TaxID=1386 RepID=UPI00031590F8|nr:MULTISPECIES: DUF3899 domain-containing protein [Bacillus]